jgi:uncharacterized protein (TIGR02597 family)
MSSAIAQDVSSTPVGYVTITINGNGYTAVTNPLQNAVVYSGTASSVASDTITTSFSLTADEIAATDAEGNSAYYVQTASGAIYDVTANTDSTITVSSDVSSLISADDAISVKKYTTLADIFSSDNSFGLTSGGDVASSDVVYVMSSEGAGTYAQYYYQTDPFGGFLGGDGWRLSGDANTDRSNVIVAPDDGLIVNRISSGDISLVVSGTVNAVNHSRELPAGFSLVAYPFPVDTTLDDSGIYAADNGYVSAGDVAQSDVVYVLSSNGSFTQYYRQTDPFGGFLGGDGWRIAGDANTDVGSTVIPAGSAVIIKHIGSGLTWSDSVPYTL